MKFLIILMLMPFLGSAQTYKEHVDDLWESLSLSGKISKLLFHKGVTGYYNLKYEGKIKGSKLIIVDYRQPSSEKRFYIINIEMKQLLWIGYVAHGVKSGKKYAIQFSNEKNSWQSSLGFFITSEEYIGKNGISLKLDGLDKGYNNNARDRNIVIHGANYVDSLIVGHSKGCIAIPKEHAQMIINTIKNGNCLLFIIENIKERYQL